jgi:hypothetical protein
MRQLFFAFCLLLTTIAGRTQDTAGTYLPVISGAFNSTVTANIAHFIQVDSEMYVIGKVFISGTTNAGQGSHFGISIPVPSTLPASNSLYGVCTIYQSSGQPIAGQVQCQGGFIFVFWTPTQTTPANMIYSFTYSITH